MEQLLCVCPNCSKPVDVEIHDTWPGTSDKVVVVHPCPDCFADSGDVQQTIKEGAEEQQYAASKEVLAKLLNVAKVMSTNDWDVAPDQTQEQNLRKLIDSDEDLSLVLFNIDRKEKGK